VAVNKTKKPSDISLRCARIQDLDALETLENTCFETDRLSRRRMSYWIKADHGILVLAEKAGEVLAYGLVILRKGSRSARLYSLAVLAKARGQNIACDLLQNLEQKALNKQRLFMRLEVAEDNQAAINMYKKLGYRKFGIYRHYYETGADALRFQKSIQQTNVANSMPYYPWYKQTTEFTCGPSALMMAMKYLNNDSRLDQATEIDIWRHATTVFMTSGHGGCHPLGLALFAHDRGFEVEVFSTQVRNLFVDGVRSEHKKSIMRIVEQGFIEKAKELGVTVHETEIQLNQIESALEKEWGVICLISTYQFDGRKAPHWVAITHSDERCLYLHDPDGSEGFYSESGKRLDSAKTPETANSEDIDLDYQHLPILKEDFASLSVFGKSKLRTCLVIKPSK
jgi:ribosomal protein S18 acetylase RimI-like enzyme